MKDLNDGVPNIDDGPKGYKPIQLEYKEGHLWLPDGTMFIPDFPVGSERWQIDLFIEYERTFGRGKAFEITHQISKESRDPKILEKYGGQSLLSEFKMLGQIVPLITAEVGNKEKVTKYLEKIKEFRARYSLLYEDSDEHQNPGHLY